MIPKFISFGASEPKVRVGVINERPAKIPAWIEPLILIVPSFEW
jgi:hypothetical protein